MSDNNSLALPDGTGSREPSPAVSAIPASIPSAGECGYYDREWACREGGYLYDADGDGYDPSDVTHPCPSCNTAEYLRYGVEHAQCLSQYQWFYTSGAEQFRRRVETALKANQAVASTCLAEIGPVACLDWADPERPDFGNTVTVIENASGIAARSDETQQAAQPEARARPDARTESSHDH